jgi:general secretion pathway protein A
MYASHFGLSALPFSASATPKSTYQSLELTEALGHFTYAIENRESFLLLTGEVGSGKTTAIRAALGKFRLDMSIAVVNHATLTPREVLEAVALGYKLETDKRESKPKLIQRLETKFARCRATGRPALLIFDEAHLLKPAVLEELRLLSNLSRNGEALVQIFLVGQPELEKRIQRSNRSLRQRITIRYQLEPLSCQETCGYIAHRLQAVGCSKPSKIFSRDAMAAVHHVSGGLPREINTVAGYAMLNCFLADGHQVKCEHVKSVQSNYRLEGVTEESVPPRAPAAVVELVLAHPEMDGKAPSRMVSWSVLLRYLDSVRRVGLRKLATGAGIMVLAATFGAWMLGHDRPTVAPSERPTIVDREYVPDEIDAAASRPKASTDKALPRVAPEPSLEKPPVIKIDEALTEDPGRPVTIQIASLLDPEQANRSLARAIDRTDIPGAVQVVSAGDTTWYLILLGYFPNVEEAEATVRPVLPRLRDQDIAEVRIKRAPTWLRARLAGEATTLAKRHP